MKKPYIDGFLLAVPKNNAAAYIKFANFCSKIWIEHGALACYENQASDVQPGIINSYPQALLLKPGEEVWFSFIVYKSKADRNKIMKKVMADPRLEKGFEIFKTKPIWDTMRMMWGGFQNQVLVTSNDKKASKTKVGNFKTASIEGKYTPVKISKPQKQK